MVSGVRCQPSRRPEKFTRPWRAADLIKKETYSFTAELAENAEKKN